MKKITHTLLLFMITTSLSFGQAFITTWKTDNPGTSDDDQITLPLSGSGYNFDVDWGDGNSDIGVTNTGAVTHTYLSPGTYEVSITGDFPRMFFNSGGDRNKLLTIEAWGDIVWKGMDLAFAGCFNMTIEATDTPNLSNVTSLVSTFAACKELTTGMENWDVSTITNMSFTFFNSPKVNMDLSSWDVSNVTNMSGLFGGNSLSDFNGDISGWDVSQVTSFTSMFSNAEDFNIDISGWDVSNATNMQDMFFGSSSFNQDISGWDVSKVTTMQGMFFDADSFNQNLGNWDVSAVTTMSLMLSSSGLNNINYDRTLYGWSQQNLQSGVELGATGLEYCSGVYRQNLIDNFSWSFIEDSQSADCPFITTWKTDNSGTSSSNQITIPTNGTGYNYDIDWGDGSSDTGVSGNITHTYSSTGTYTVSIDGDFPSIYFNNEGDKSKLLTIEQWGDNLWSSFERAFYGCNNMTMPATDIPDLSNVSSFFRTFSGASNFNGYVGNWDVSTITNMFGTFAGADAFNQDIGDWDVSNVTTMEYMFDGADIFNQDISSWDVGEVLSMRGMFFGVSNFNQPLGSWDVSKVNTMRDMFMGTAINEPLDSWDVSSVTNMINMFRDVTEFDQDISNWNISNVTDMSDMFDDSGLSVANYDKILLAWSQLSVKPNVTLGASGISYCEGSGARDVLTSAPNNWTINDAGEYCVVNIPDAYFKAALLANTSINTIDDGEITFDEAEAYTGSIVVRELGIQDLTGIEAFPNIDFLDCFGNELTSLDLTGNTALTSINSRSNLLTSIDVSGLTALEHFDFANNVMTSIDVSTNTGLLYLGFNGNQLTTVDVSNNINLQDIGGYENQLTSIDVSSNPVLEYLEIYDNQLTEVDVSSNPLLVGLAFDNNQLTSLNIANGNNTNFEFFSANGNPNLTCITVDDIAFAEANFTDVDEVANFSTNCSNTANNITAFSFTEQAIDAIIDTENYTVVIDVVSGTDFTNLTPTFTISDGASADPASGIAQDFSSDFVYTITAENPTAIQEWTVTVREENVAPSDISLSAMSIDENNAIDDVIGSFSSADANNTDMHSYSLVSGNGDTDNASFDISGSELIAKEVFDFEIVSSYSIRVQSNDGRGGTFEKEFTISINDLDDQEAQEITFNVIDNQFFEAGSLTLSATASSGLEVAFDLVSGPGTLAGNVVTFTDLGTIVVSASQAGNGAFFPADPVEQSFEVITVTGLDGENSALLIYPNPADDVLTIQTQEENITLQLLNAHGSDVMSIKPNVSNNISQLDNGIYFLLISDSQGVTTHKIIKQ